jgi:uncharacterized protein (DUF2237 family)
VNSGFIAKLDLASCLDAESVTQKGNFCRTPSGSANGTIKAPTKKDCMNTGVTLNVLGQPLVPCSFDPLTGFFRDGCCKTNAEDAGSHLICAIVTNDFLQFSLSRGNNLITPAPQYQFPGLIAGDQWCLCINRWLEALDANCAPLVKLESTNIKALEKVSLSLLQQYSSES